MDIKQNNIHCFSFFWLQKNVGEGGGYLLFIFRGQRLYATLCETEMSEGESSNNTGQKERKQTENSFNFVGCTNTSS